MPSAGTLFIWLIAGIFGMAYFVYGKRAQRPVFLLAGIGLCVYPYLVSGVLLGLLVGVLIAAAPFLIRD
jgi:hypothetical protein